MQKLKVIATSLEEIAPLALAESWDSVGLLVGEADGWIRRAMTCLTVTDATLGEAIDRKANLIIAHHPLPFKPQPRITDETPTGRLLIKAIRHEVAIYSPHTAWDNALLGINRRLGEFVGLIGIEPLSLSREPELAKQGLGTGIMGSISPTQGIVDVVRTLRQSVPHIEVRTTHEPHRQVAQLGIVCGSGGSLVSLAAQRHCDAFLTGEATYHQCLEAEALGVAMIMIGHHASEYFAMQALAVELQSRVPDVEFWCSEREHSRF
jgi:dinuclear metal center YbgI/SA1388 family protein